MNISEGYTRLNNEDFDSIKLPVYFRSFGYKCFDRGTKESSTETHSPFFEMIWGVRGVGEVTLFNEVFQLLPDEVFFYHPYERHQLHAISQGWTLYWVTFDGPGAVAFFDGYKYSRKMHAAGPCPIELFDKIKQEIGGNSPETVRLMLARLCQLLALAGGRDHSDNDLVEQALNLIRRNIANPELNVNFLADQLEVHRSTLIKQFKKKLNRHPGLAIRDRRLHMAEALLRRSTLPIKEIARSCGLPLGSTFSRFFFHCQKISPMQYRRQHQKLDSEKKQGQSVSDKKTTKGH